MRVIKNLFSILLLTVFFASLTKAQEIEVIAEELFISDTIGSEMIFDFEVINISNEVQTVFEVRTVNDLPPNWQSSLCFGQNCFAPQIDSIATTQNFGTPPLNPGDTLITSLHVYALMNDGTANVQIQIGTFNNPDNRVTLDFVGTTQPTGISDFGNTPNSYFLEQNYPNPFNPSTNITFGIKEDGNVSLKIYDVLGREVKELMNEYKKAGTYSITFDASDLTSGVYFYKLTSNNFTSVKKMILEK